MPRFYFHLSARDEEFPDEIGYELIDLSAAHSRAVQIVDRVLMFSALSDRTPHLRRLLVKITDDNLKLVLTVIIGLKSSSSECRLGVVTGRRVNFDPAMMRQPMRWW